jgi:DNA-directed RNA polymerase specialized sigma24 family protein
VGQAALEQAGLERAGTGDEQAFRELIDPYRRELLAHCYRMLGSLTDAEDMLQETLLSAWRGLPRFEGRSTLRSWLYRIATNTCLNAMRSTARQVPTEPTPPFQPPEPTQRDEITWLQPYPDNLLDGIPDSAQAPRRGTAKPKLFSSPSLLACSACRLGKRQQFCCVMFSALAPTKWRPC